MVSILLSTRPPVLKDTFPLWKWPPICQHKMSLGSRIYVESDPRKIKKNKRFWDRIIFLMSFGVVFSKKAVGAQKLQFGG